MSLKDLYEKVEAFERKLSAEARGFSQCRKGCSRCCHVDLSVFQLEAEAVTSWFEKKSAEEKEELRGLWSGIQPSEQCAFLVNDACTIYEARPLICRTQGLPLRFHENGETYADVCPLNEEMLNVVTAEEVLNLDLVNTILSKLERAGGEERPRVRLHDLRSGFLKR